MLSELHLIRNYNINGEIYIIQVYLELQLQIYSRGITLQNRMVNPMNFSGLL